MRTIARGQLLSFSLREQHKNLPFVFHPVPSTWVGFECRQHFHFEKLLNWNSFYLGKNFVKFSSKIMLLCFEMLVDGRFPSGKGLLGPLLLLRLLELLRVSHGWSSLSLKVKVGAVKACSAKLRAGPSGHPNPKFLSLFSESSGILGVGYVRHLVLIGHPYMADSGHPSLLATNMGWYATWVANKS